MLQEILTSFLLVFSAEFGDKTQLLSLTLAARFGFRKAVAGVILAIILLQAAAVTVGSLAGTLLSGPLLSLAAGAVFLGFGVFLLIEGARGSRSECTCGHDAGRPAAFGIAAVAALFFMAELGDKTQLVTLVLAARSQVPWAVWIGAALGMASANLPGVFVGRYLNSIVSPRMVKIAAGIIFVLFGLAGLFGRV